MVQLRTQPRRQVASTCQNFFNHDPFFICNFSATVSAVKLSKQLMLKFIYVRAAHSQVDETIHSNHRGRSKFRCVGGDK